MAPPPATPSPRRFIASKPPKEKATPKPSSNLRFQTIAAPQRPEPPPLTRPSPAQFATPKPKGDSRPSSSHQFAATPRFALAKSKRQDVPIRSPPKSRPAVAQLRPQESFGESIEDASQEKPCDEEDDVMIMDSVGTRLEAEDEEVHHDYPSSPKRPRLSTLEHTTPRRFVFGNQALTPSIATPDHPHTTSRPQFIKPASLPAEHAEPLPEAFSPHRRKEKFVPGGMAATARQWILDASQTAHHTHTRRSIAGAASDLLPVRVLEANGSAKDGVVLVRGKIDGREVKLLLPGQGKKRGSPDNDLKVGDTVGIGSVRWDVEIGGEVWVVCVEWRAVDG